MPALDVPTQKESLVRSLICKVQTSLAKVIKATVSHPILSLPLRGRRVYLTALISCLPSSCFYTHVFCPTLPKCASMCQFCLTCSGVSIAHEFFREVLVPFLCSLHPASHLTYLQPRSSGPLCEPILTKLLLSFYERRVGPVFQATHL